jgi:SAM-dependent methyltransferase
MWFGFVIFRYRFSQKNIKFLCNICGKESEGAEIDVFDREKVSCRHCGSNLRARTIVDILSNQLFGKSIVLIDFPVDKSVKGLGVSDWLGYANLLTSKFSYSNTYLHKEPKFDITNISVSDHGKYDFIIISEVLEHIDPPVMNGINNIYSLLKPNGICIITVPFMNFETTMEHYPDLYVYKIIVNDGKQVLVNTTKDGMVQTFGNLVFHGGGGATLEKRIFTRRSLYDNLHRAGFVDIEYYRSVRPQFGITWVVNWSLPLSARRKKSTVVSPRRADGDFLADGN